MPGFATLRTRFDEVLDWNAAIAPQHPSAWAPRPEDVPLWERQLRAVWGLGEDRVELIVESIQVPPARTLCTLFPGATVDVYADGLMSYGPTRFRLDPQLGMRVRRVLHLDLVPGLDPLLLTEFDVPPELVPTPEFLKVLAELPSYGPGPTGTGEEAGFGEAPALLLGQYLSALELLSPRRRRNSTWRWSAARTPSATANSSSSPTPAHPPSTPAAPRPKPSGSAPASPS